MRDAFGRFATGIVIVTTQWGGERIGATVSSFNSVSLSPPLVSFCIARSAHAIDVWENTPSFGISVLARDQAELSTRFARSLSDKWAGVATRPAARVPAPLIDGALMWLECQAYARYDGGDHVILLGRVVAATVNNHVAQEPLLFYGAAYRHLAPKTPQEKIPDNAMWLHGW